jgi:hypothetical protein
MAFVNSIVHEDEHDNEQVTSFVSISRCFVVRLDSFECVRLSLFHSDQRQSNKQNRFESFNQCIDRIEQYQCTLPAYLEVRTNNSFIGRNKSVHLPSVVRHCLE